MLPGEIVKKSNELARAAWAVQSVLEPRIVALVAARVRTTDKDFQTYEIPTTEILPSGNGEDYVKLKAACNRLLTTAIDLPDKEGDGWTLYSVFSKCRHDPKRMVVQARFDPDLKSHYLDLAGRFTEYNLFEFLMLPTTYSQRLFEVLKSWDDQPERIEPMTTLFKMLGVPLSMQRYPDFRRKVLQPAHSYITEKTSLRYHWEPVRLQKGRGYDAIRFVFSDARQATVAKKKRAKAEEDQSAKNNRLMRMATNCAMEHHAGRSQCTPRDGDEMCVLCKRLVTLPKK
jgi:plasmid replication initiation protein